MTKTYLESLSSKPLIKVELVCLGNICRSPLAAAALHNKDLAINPARFAVSSSGTSGWNDGQGANPNSIKVWEGAGYSYQHTSSQFSARSFAEIDLILAMDLTNRANILNAAQSDQQREKVFMLRSFDPLLTHIDPTSPEGDQLQIPDPWGESILAYQEVFVMIESAIDGLISRYK